MTATWGDIAKANNEIKTITLKNKEYAEVKERVIAFRKVYPQGSIITELLTLNKEEVIFIARAYATYVEDTVSIGKQLLSTGYARGKSNKYFALEDTETSAVGRCLAFAGFGVKTSIASAEEMQETEVTVFDEPPIQEQKADLAMEFDKLFGPREKADILNGLHVKYAEDIQADLLKQIIDNKKYGNTGQ